MLKKDLIIIKILKKKVINKKRLSLGSFFHNYTKVYSFGNIFPKLDFLFILTYNHIRGENYDRANSIFGGIEKMEKPRFD